MDQLLIRNLLAHFQLEGELEKFVPMGSGHIHDTLLIELHSPRQKVVLQRFNDQVFQRPHEVMLNIVKVTEHLRLHGESIRESGKSLKVISTIEGETILKADEAYWRLFNYIENSYVIDKVTESSQAREGALAFGRFCQALLDFPPNELNTTIEDFHNLVKRYDQLAKAADQDPLGRVTEYPKPLKFALSRKPRVEKLHKLAFSSGLPLRVTHNDTKINNVLFDRDSAQGICVVDLDTVMPGLVLYDFGDMARTFCNAVYEEDPWQEANFNMEVFASMCEGFLKPLKPYLSPAELNSLTQGPWYLTYIMGIRFLADFYRGDTYYKIDHPLQNLQRAQNQFQLLRDIENKQSIIDKMIAELG